MGEKQAVEGISIDLYDFAVGFEFGGSGIVDPLHQGDFGNERNRCEVIEQDLTIGGGGFVKFEMPFGQDRQIARFFSLIKQDLAFVVGLDLGHGIELLQGVVVEVFEQCNGFQSFHGLS